MQAEILAEELGLEGINVPLPELPTLSDPTSDTIATT
jgi:hypothetical protein